MVNKIYLVFFALFCSLDKLLDGGLKSGEVVEIFGNAASGKTRLCLKIAMHFCLALKRKVLFLDPLASVTSSMLFSVLQEYCNEKVTYVVFFHKKLDHFHLRK